MKDSCVRPDQWYWDQHIKHRRYSDCITWGVNSHLRTKFKWHIHWTKESDSCSILTVTCQQHPPDYCSSNSITWCSSWYTSVTYCCPCWHFSEGDHCYTSSMKSVISIEYFEQSSPGGDQLASLRENLQGTVLYWFWLKEYVLLGATKIVSVPLFI